MLGGVVPFWLEIYSTVVFRHVSRTSQTTSILFHIQHVCGCWEDFSLWNKVHKCSLQPIRKNPRFGDFVNETVSDCWENCWVGAAQITARPVFLADPLLQLDSKLRGTAFITLDILHQQALSAKKLGAACNGLDVVMRARLDWVGGW